MAKAKRARKSAPSKTTSPRAYIDVKLERIEKGLLTVQATVGSFIADVQEIRAMLKPKEEEAADGAEKG